MTSPPLLLWLAGLALLAIVSAGPLGPLPNVTSLDLGLKDGTCAVGDVAYAAGEEVPGGAACERCRCEGGAVRCVRPRCEPRPGCKALHRPDHCCPTYQCECEQEGRVYSNGEKLVDPADPCRVCYCQGGEVVCRRIACFVRDDCTPRLVPGRCCPEYDNCPLRGVTTVAGVTPAMSTVEETPSSPAPTPPKETVKQEITIKEITPVSEIPVISDVKVKEILPSPGIDVPDYSSSKSPLIVREATTESFIASNSDSKLDVPAIIEILTPSSTAADPSTTSDKSIENVEPKITNDTPPSKISLSTQDSINNEMYSNSFATIGSPSVIPEVAITATTKAPMVEEEDQSLFDHNPAFPPIPDDLSVIGNHEDEIVEQVADNEHMPLIPEIVTTSSPPHTDSPSTIEFKADEQLTTVALKTPDAVPTTLNEPTTSDYHSSNDNNDNAKGIRDTTSAFAITTEAPLKQVKDSPMLNLRSAIPTEILNVPSFVPEEINGEPDDGPESTTNAVNIVSSALPVIEQSYVIEEKPIEKLELPATITSTSEAATESLTSKSAEQKSISSKLPEEPTITTAFTEPPTPESKQTDEPTTISKLKDVPMSTTQQLEESKTSPSLPTIVTESDPVIDRESKIDTTLNPSSTSSASEPTKEVTEQKSSIVTEITAQTEFSSLPIETSDQNPQENSELIEKERAIASTADPSPADVATTKMVTSLEPEVITVSRAVPSSTDRQNFESIETTEFVLTPFSSSNSSPDNIELIKISADPEQSAPIIEATASEEKKNNVLNDLINLVGDVAAIGDHTDAPSTPHIKTTASISESDELIPVNAGYKSKNNNWNLNSITEVPIKSKNSAPITKQKVVEIEESETESITDSPPPNDKVEPTTRRPIIDNVSDDGRGDNNTDKKDIEIITKSYVPTISRRPTKVVMKKHGEDRPALTEGDSADVSVGERSSNVDATGESSASPIKPVVSLQSKIPTKEVTVAQPASPSEPEQSTQLPQSSQTTVTEQPVQSEHTTLTAESTQSAQPKQPSQSAQSQKPAKFEQPAQPAHIAKSEQSVKLEQPAQATEIAKSAQSEQSEQPAQVTQPVHPVQVAQSEQPAQSDQITKSAQFEQPAQSAQTTETVEPVQAAQFEQAAQAAQSEQTAQSEQAAQPPQQSTQPEQLASSTPAPATITPQH